MVPTLHIYLLGDFRLISDDTPVTSIVVPRLLSLLAYLALHHNAPQSRAQLAYLLWPDSTDTQAHANLRTLVPLAPEVATRERLLPRRQACAPVAAQRTLDAGRSRESQQAWRQEMSARLHERVGDILALTGQHGQARDA